MKRGQKDDSLYINFNIPLANLLGGEHHRSGFNNLSTQMRTDFNGGHQLSMNSSGSSEDNKFNYSVNTGYTMQKRVRTSLMSAATPATSRRGVIFRPLPPPITTATVSTRFPPMAALYCTAAV